MLETGRITHNQVSYESVEPSTWGAIQVSQESGVEDENSMRQSSGQVVNNPLQSQAPLVTETDFARQTGDTECYKIYLGSWGWRIVTVVLALSVANAAMEVMPRECNQPYLPFYYFGVTCSFPDRGDRGLDEAMGPGRHCRKGHGLCGRLCRLQLALGRFVDVGFLGLHHCGHAKVVHPSSPGSLELNHSVRRSSILGDPIRDNDQHSPGHRSTFLQRRIVGTS
jgi:hypothetical protein